MFASGGRGEGGGGAQALKALCDVSHPFMHNCTQAHAHTHTFIIRRVKRRMMRRRRGS
jgi:hypothetical protein